MRSRKTNRLRRSKARKQPSNCRLRQRARSSRFSNKKERRRRQGRRLDIWRKTGVRVRRPESEVRGPKSKVQSPKSKVQSPRWGGRGQRTEVRGQRSEDRGQ